jgi:hypothetical protein
MDTTRNRTIVLIVALVALTMASTRLPADTGTGAASFGAFGACSDGLNFWITLFSTGKLARF